MPVCVTVNVCPAIVSVPVRAVPLLLAATWYVTVPSPVPDDPPVIVMKVALLCAVHEQAEPVVTPMDPLPVLDAKLALAGDKL